jgi:uncharacterized membrane protein
MSGPLTPPNNYFVDDDPFALALPADAALDSRSRVRNVARSVAERRNLAVIVLIVLYIGWFIHLNLQSFNTYGEPPYDLAIFDQGMWLITHFHVPFVTIMGRNLFGDHTSFVLYLFAPFYRLFPEPQGLLVLQTLLIAAASVPIYVLARKYLKSALIATALVAAYLLNPLIQQGNLDQFHPECFQVLFITLAIYAAIERKNRMLIVMVVLSLLVKEDAALLVIPLGLWVAARRDRRLGLSIVAGSVAYAMIANWLIIPSILGATSIYAGRIPFGGFSGLLSTLFGHPGQFFSYAGSQGRPFYLWQLASTVGFAFLFAPEIAFIGLLVVAENTISDDGYMHQILYQYSMALAPVLVLGVLYALAQQSSLWRRNAITALVLVGAIWTCSLWGYAPFSSNHVFTSTVASTSIKPLASLESEIPSNAVVSAWYPLVAHLDARTQIYVWPNPFFASNYGVAANLTGTRLPASSQVQYLLLPTPLNPTQNPGVFSRIARGYRIIGEQGGFALYEQTSTS